jgi:hypothetical protein
MHACDPLRARHTSSSSVTPDGWPDVWPGSESTDPAVIKKRADVRMRLCLCVCVLTLAACSTPSCVAKCTRWRSAVLKSVSVVSHSRRCCNKCGVIDAVLRRAAALTDCAY